MPGLRDMLTQMMTPSRGGGAPPVGPAEYQKLLDEAMGRVGYDRDQAVRSANIAGGFGNSTAQQFMHGMGGGAGVDPMTTGAVPIPTPRPDVAPAPTAADPGIGSGIPTPVMTGDPPVDLPAAAPTPMPRDNRLVIGDAPALPEQGVPIPKPGGQYRIKPDPRKKQKKRA